MNPTPTRKLQIAAAAILSTAMLCSAAMAKQAVPYTKVNQKIDLSFASVEANKIGTTGGNDRVRITLAVKATTTAHKACSGMFKVKLEKEAPTGWALIGTGGITDMCAGTMMAKIPIKKVYFDDLVPSDLAGARKYRAVIDYDNRVDEMNEGNNIGGTRYIP